MSIFSSRRSISKRGFTLIELLVAISIMVIVTGAMLFRQARFDSATLLRSLTYSVALTVRQAQVYGTSVFGTTTSTGVVFASGYGVYINWGTGTPTSYTLFADLNSNGTYDSGEDVKVYSLGQGFNISNICVTTVGGSPTQFCTSGGVTWLSIIFKRPNPEACFTSNLNSSACSIGSSAAYSSASIQIQAATGDVGVTRSIFMNSTGQISVNTLLGS